MSEQLDPIFGCPALQVPDDHPARSIKSIIAELDLSAFHKMYSSLGRHGYDPRHALGAWVLGSIQGIHFATDLSRAMKTDAALRFVSGGHALSAGALKRFRAHGELFLGLLQQTLALAVKRKLIDPEQLAVDSVRMRAHASMGAVRTKKRSEERLTELQAVDVSSLGEKEKVRHDAKVRKHEQAIRECSEKNCTSVVVTNPSAALMKFPNGGYGPGHRVTVAAAGVKERFVVSVLIDGAATDFGKLEPSLTKARTALERAGVPVGQCLQVAADAGYFCETDLLFAQRERASIDVLVPEPPGHANRGRLKGLFNRDAFRFEQDGTVTCPAGSPMLGPVKDGRGDLRFSGQGCETCPLRPACTKSKTRILVVNPAFEQARNDMRSRMAEPKARERYNQRIATIEPVFSVLEDRMRFRRVSTRHEVNSQAEILLKLLAYNLVRLVKATARLFCVRVIVCEESLAGAFVLGPIVQR